MPHLSPPRAVAALIVGLLLGCDREDAYGKASFTETQLVENYAAALDEVLRLKPSAAKGRYIKKATFSSTMGPGVQVDSNRVKNLTVEDDI